MKKSEARTRKGQLMTKEVIAAQLRGEDIRVGECDPNRDKKGRVKPKRKR